MSWTSSRLYPKYAAWTVRLILGVVGLVVGGTGSGNLVWAGKTVVLDPGHGGEQSGTQSVSGLKEKDLVLSIAQKVRAQLIQAGIEVRLTRTDDRDIPLPARPEMAGRVFADAFVSIHLNHAPDPERRGWETYVLSAEASDAWSRKLLEREEGKRPPQLVPKNQGDLAFIFKDLTQTAAHAKSAKLAKIIQVLVDSGGPGLKPSRGLRQAPFLVLTGVKVPAVLVEMGYLSNVKQAKYFSSEAGQQDAAQVLAQGILRFLRR